MKQHGNDALNVDRYGLLVSSMLAHFAAFLGQSLHMKAALN